MAKKISKVESAAPAEAPVETPVKPLVSGAKPGFTPGPARPVEASEPHNIPVAPQAPKKDRNRFDDDDNGFKVPEPKVKKVSSKTYQTQAIQGSTLKTDSEGHAEDIQPAPSPAIKAVAVPASRPNVASEELPAREGFPTPEECLQVHGIRTLLDAAIPFEGKNLCLCLPFFKTTNPMTMIALLAYAMDFGREKLTVQWAFGDSMVENARNICAKKFLATNAEWSLWIDDDIIPPFGRAHILREETGLSSDPKSPYHWPDHIAGEHAALRLLSHNQKIVGGTYFGRRRISPVMFHQGMVNRDAYESAKKVTGELIATDWVGTGFLLIHRDVFVAIEQAFPDLAPNQHNQFFAYFAKDVGLGEDMSFCRRAKAVGFQPYVDTGVQCLHVGNMAYGFHNTQAEYKPSANGLF